MTPRAPLVARRRAAAAVALLTGLAGVLTACSGDDETTPKPAPQASDCPWKPSASIGTLRIGYRQLPNADVVVKDQRLLERCLPDATVSWTRLADDTAVADAFAARTIDVGVLTPRGLASALSAPRSLQLAAFWAHDRGDLAVATRTFLDRDAELAEVWVRAHTEAAEEVAGPTADAVESTAVELGLTLGEAEKRLTAAALVSPQEQAERLGALPGELTTAAARLQESKKIKKAGPASLYAAGVSDALLPRTAG